MKRAPVWGKKFLKQTREEWQVGGVKDTKKSAHKEKRTPDETKVESGREGDCSIEGGNRRDGLPTKAVN